MCGQATDRQTVVVLLPPGGVDLHELAVPWQVPSLVPPALPHQWLLVAVSEPQLRHPICNARWEANGRIGLLRVVVQHPDCN